MIWNRKFSYVKAGARMVIHDPEEQPLIDEFGIAINPATYTLAAITEVSAQNKKTITKEQM